MISENLRKVLVYLFEGYIEVPTGRYSIDEFCEEIGISDVSKVLFELKDEGLVKNVSIERDHKCTITRDGIRLIKPNYFRNYFQMVNHSSKGDEWENLEDITGVNDFNLLFDIGKALEEENVCEVRFQSDSVWINSNVKNKARFY